MADDLMDFSEAENNENIRGVEQDENDIPIAPGLVQSPVIVNSILKQSNKDNLIQLYTPVQKPEKGRLKVHFGHDSLLQTPTVKMSTKIIDTVQTIKEETENAGKVVGFATEDKENASEVPQQMVATEQSASSNDTKPGAHIDDTTELSGIKDDAVSAADSVDSALELSAMEVDICEPPENVSTTDAVSEMLLQAELLLKTIQEGSTHPSPNVDSAYMSHDKDVVNTKVDVEGTPENNESETCSQSLEVKNDSIEVVKKDCSEAGQSGDFTKHIESNKVLETTNETEELSQTRESEVGFVNQTEQEPMDCEAMDVDEDDDDNEIVFNIGKNIVQEHIPSDEIKEIIATSADRNEKGNGSEEVNDVTGEKTDASSQKSGVNACTENNREGATENMLKIIENDVKTETSDDAEKEVDVDKCVSEFEETPVLKVTDVAEEGAQKSTTECPPESNAGQIEMTDKKDTVSSKTGGDNSSDEEFMSADEDMEVDETRTPAKSAVIDPKIQPEDVLEPKQESPERVPPKVGYNLNFDDLESLDPFATKKSLVNSPDVGKQTKVVEENDMDKSEKTAGDSELSQELVSETVTLKEDKNEQFKSANTSPAKSEPPRAELVLSPNPALKDEECKDITDADIFQEKTDCLLHEENVTETDSLIPNGESDIEQGKIDATKGIDYNSVNPFKPKTQISNTPDKVKEELHTESPKSSKAKLEIADKSTDEEKVENNLTKKCNRSPEGIQTQTSEQQMTDDNKVTPKKEVTASPAIALSRGTYNLDALELGDIDPFQPSKQMSNSPSVTSSQEAGSSEDIDPFKPKKQMKNSPNHCAGNKNLNQEEIDPFKPKKQITNSPVAKKDSTEVNTEVKNKTGDDVTDPFIPKPHIQDSPSDKLVSTCSEDIDPFKPKSQIVNSPVNKISDADGKLNNSDFDCLENIDPFKPKTLILNSPTGKELKNVDPSADEDCAKNDPFKSKSKVQNSPQSRVEEKVDIEAVEDPFKPINQMQNSPSVKELINETSETKNTEETDNVAKKNLENGTDPFSDINPFKSKKQLKMSPEANSGQNTDPFADLNPFEPQKKVASTPEKEKATENQTQDNQAKTDVLIVKNKRANSIMLETIEENPFVTTSRVANSPAKQDDPFAQTVELPTTPPMQHIQHSDVLGDIFEVQGVTVRGKDMAHVDKFGEDETQFVPASEVFNDPAAWEMLEKLGSTTPSKGESALSRLSLYVKFDPLVDEAPVANPRRISIRMSQLEKVKEYGLDETLLLLGTPPKKRSQSTTTPQTKNTPKSASSSILRQDKKPETGAAAPGAVDLILAYSPKKKEQVHEVDAPFMAKLDDDAPEESGNLFQELKYTDADLKRIQRDYELALQGMLINKDQEWCKKEKVWAQKYGDLGKKCKQIREDRDKLEQAFLSLEQTVYEIAAARDALEKKVEEVTLQKQQGLEDIQAVETAFSDLHRRYEKARNLLMINMKNEETLKTHAASLQEKLKQSDEKLHLLEGTQEKLNALKVTNEKLQSQRDSIQSKYDAQMKLMQMKVENLETSLQRKTEENKQLTEICDNLLAKVDQ